MYQLGNTLAKLAQDAGAEIRLNTEVTPELVAAIQPDALIIAVGSLPVQPPIPGLQGDNVILVNNYYQQKDQVGDRVIVLGGGLAGCETAIHLAREGKQVALIEMRGELAPDANIRHRPLLLKRNCSAKHSGLHPAYRQQITADGVHCVDADGKDVFRGWLHRYLRPGAKAK